MSIIEQLCICYKKAINKKLCINAVFVDVVPFEDFVLRQGFNNLINFLNNKSEIIVLVTGLDVIAKFSRDLEIALELLPVSTNVKVVGNNSHSK